MLSTQFIRRGTQPNRYDHFVAAPLFRKTFTLNRLPAKAVFSIGTPGFYRLYINGKDITKGPLAPYISNPDHILYCDTYDIRGLLNEGRNAIVILAGNGNGSAPGGSVWSFEKFPWTDAAKIAFELDIDGEISEADTTVKCGDSAIYFDDLRSGERCDGRRYNPAFFTAEYDDSGWDNAIYADAPGGYIKNCEAHPVSYTGNDYEGYYTGRHKVSTDYHPHSLSYGETPVTPQEDFMKGEAFVYDFGINTTGMPVFTVNGKAGRRLEFQFAEYIDRYNEVSYNNINFYPDGYSQRDVYICRGEENETYAPQFTYHGARYCAVFGLDDEMKKSFRITFRQISTVKERFVDFRCSDENAEKIFNMCVNSDISNLVYFPTDCPHREKNGWTGDAANSSARMSMYYDLYDDYREWMNNIRKAQRPDGGIPTIIPTHDWGYDRINPSWDKAIALIPWNAYRFTGRKEILTENCEAIYRYIKHMDDCLDRDDNLFPRDIGDWLCVDAHKKADFRITAAASCCDVCECAEKIFRELGKREYIPFTRSVAERARQGIRAHYINRYNGICCNASQSSQSIAIAHGFFTEDEMPLAKQRLMEAVKNDDEHFCFGLQGAMTLFPVLIGMGGSELVWKMIMREDYPSYAHFLKQGLTAIPENFYHDDEHDINSLNHHMFGMVAMIFTENIAGLKAERGKVHLQPSYIKDLTFAEAGYSTGEGEIIFRWERSEDGTITNYLTAPENTEITFGELEGRIVIDGKDVSDGNRKGYSLFHETWGRR